jgi:hypothetical protein
MTVKFKTVEELSCVKKQRQRKKEGKNVRAAAM